MTPEQKSKLKARENELREKRHGSRLDRKIDFDFAGKIYYVLLWQYNPNIMHPIINPFF